MPKFSLFATHVHQYLSRNCMRYPLFKCIRRFTKLIEGKKRFTTFASNPSHLLFPPQKKKKQWIIKWWLDYYLPSKNSGHMDKEYNPIISWQIYKIVTKYVIKGVNCRKKKYFQYFLLILKYQFYYCLLILPWVDSKKWYVLTQKRKTNKNIDPIKK